MKTINGLVINYTIFFLMVGGVEAGWLDNLNDAIDKLNKAVGGVNQPVDGEQKTQEEAGELQGLENSDNTPYSIPNQNQLPKQGQTQFPQGNQNKSSSPDRSQSGWETMEESFAQAPTGAYGTDIIGIRLGMSLQEAEKRIRENMEVGAVLKTKVAEQNSINDLNPYQSFKVFTSVDSNQSIILYTEPDITDNVVGIVRLFKFDSPMFEGRKKIPHLLTNKYSPPNKSSYYNDFSWDLAWGNDSGNSKCHLPIQQEKWYLAENVEFDVIEANVDMKGDLRNKIPPYRPTIPKMIGLKKKGFTGIESSSEFIDKVGSCGPILSVRLGDANMWMVLVDHRSYLAYLKKPMTTREKTTDSKNTEVSNLENTAPGENIVPAPQPVVARIANNIPEGGYSFSRERDLIWLNMIHFQPDLLDTETLLAVTKKQIGNDQKYYTGVAGFKPIFRREQIEGLSAALAAEELAPEFREKIMEIASSAPKRLYLGRPLSQVKYDTKRGVLTWSSHSKRSGAQSGALDLLVPNRQPIIKKLPEYIREMGVYKDSVVKRNVIWNAPVNLQAFGGYSNAFMVDTVALDRFLESEGIPVSSQQAEKILYDLENRESNKRYITSRVEFTVIGAFKGKDVYSPVGALLGRVESVTIFDPDGEVLARAPVNIFPKAGNFQPSSPPVTAKTTPQSQTAAPASKTDAMAIWASLAPNEQEKVMNRANKFQSTCSNGRVYPYFHDCECLKPKFIEEWLNTPNKSKNYYVIKIQKKCVNPPGIKVYAEDYCRQSLKYDKMNDERLGEVCACYGNRMIKLYKKNPDINTRSRLGSKAMAYCRNH
jgi:hypothetical protein